MHIKKWRTQNDGRDAEFTELAKYTEKEPSMTIQSMAEENDPNLIIQRYLSTGEIPKPLKAPFYGDFDGITDFRSALDAVRAAQENFQALPVKIRNRFQNDPQQLLEFVEDGRNLDEAIELGLIPKRPVPEAPPASPMPAVTGDKKVVPGTT